MTHQQQTSEIVISAACTWWDTIGHAGKRLGDHGKTMPACPHCGCLLRASVGEDAWLSSLAQYEASGYPDYKAMMLWGRGKCFPSPEALRDAFAALSANNQAFAAFQASRKLVSQAMLADALGVEVDEISRHGGYTYAGACWIEIYDDSQFSVIIGNSQFVDADLAKVERHLFDNWYVGEIITAGDADDDTLSLTAEDLMFSEIPAETAKEILHRWNAFKPLRTMAKSLDAMLTDDYPEGPEQAAREADVPADVVAAWQAVKPILDAVGA